MRLLLDESVPRQLAALFPREFEVLTVQRMGWAGLGNGEVLRLAAASGFDAFLTADRGIEHQQNLADLPIAVIVMIAFRTRIQELAPLVPRIAGMVAGGLPKRIHLLSTQDTKGHDAGGKDEAR